MPRNALAELHGSASEQALGIGEHNYLVLVLAYTGCWCARVSDPRVSDTRLAGLSTKALTEASKLTSN